MKKRLKTTWNDIVKVLPDNTDHPATHMLAKSHGLRVTLPVTLFKGGSNVMMANVLLFPHPDKRALDLIALTALYEKLWQHDIMVDWDTAKIGKTPEAYNKLDFLNYNGFNRSVSNYLRKPLATSLQAVERLRTSYKKANNGKDMPGNDVLDQRCAAIIGSTTTIESAQIRSILLERESWFKRKFLKPRSLEV